MKYKNTKKTSQLFPSCRRFCANICDRVFGGSPRCFRDCLACRNSILKKSKSNKTRSKKK